MCVILNYNLVLTTLLLHKVATMSSIGQILRDYKYPSVTTSTSASASLKVTYVVHVMLSNGQVTANYSSKIDNKTKQI